MAGHGRPPSDDPKIHNFQIRLSKTDADKLEFCCKKTGKTKAEIIRMGIRNIYEELKK